MSLLSFLNKQESIVAIDIGSTGLKLVEFDMTGDKPVLVHLALAPFTADVFANYAISKIDTVAERLADLLSEHGVTTKLAATAVPGPSVFTKKIKMPGGDPEELSSNIQLEAANFIPHNIDAVKLDYHVIGATGRDQLDILVVAVKTEIIESFVDSLMAAEVESAVVDVDYFALQNAFELGASEDLLKKTIAVMNIGARYTTVNICRNGHSLFTGDVAIGGKAVTDGLMTDLAISAKDAEELKRKLDKSNGAHADALEKQVATVATELNRQLAFFWNASGAEEGIDKIIISGGGSQLPGLVEALHQKTGIACETLDPFRGVELDPSIDKITVKELSPFMAIAVGLAIRQPGDKIFPEEE